MGEGERIHVLHVIDKLGIRGASVHGVTQAISRWVARFDPSEFEFSVCVLRTYEPASSMIERHGVPVYFLGKSKFDPTILTGLARLVKQKRPRVLHLHGYGATNYGRMVGTLLGIPSIVHEHTIVQNQPWYQTIADSVLAPMADRAIAISEPVKRFMVHDRKMDPDHIDTFFPGIPLSEFQVSDEADLTRLRSELGIAPEAGVVCTVGRVDTEKGQIYLIEAASRILDEIPDTYFLIVGDGPDLARLNDETRKREISDRVIFTGHREDVPELMGLADVVVISSLWEGGPLTLFEAMNVRKPVVATPVGLVEEVIEEGETGFIVPTKDASQLASKLIYVLKNPEVARRMGERGRAVCQQYDVSESVKKLTCMYRELVYEGVDAGR